MSESETQRLEREVRESEERRLQTKESLPGQSEFFDETGRVLENLDSLSRVVEAARKSLKSQIMLEGLIRKLSEDGEALRGHISEQQQTINQLSEENQAAILNVIRQAVTDNPGLLAKEQDLIAKISAELQER